MNTEIETGKTFNVSKNFQAITRDSTTSCYNIFFDLLVHAAIVLNNTCTSTRRPTGIWKKYFTFSQKVMQCLLQNIVEACRVSGCQAELVSSL